jgi:hypothetical protein
MNRFYVIEYTDEEGELVIKHALLSPEEARKILDAMAESGINGSIMDISPTPDAIGLRLEEVDNGLEP